MFPFGSSLDLCMRWSAEFWCSPATSMTSIDSTKKGMREAARKKYTKTGNFGERHVDINLHFFLSRFIDSQGRNLERERRIKWIRRLETISTRIQSFSSPNTRIIMIKAEIIVTISIILNCTFEKRKPPAPATVFTLKSSKGFAYASYSDRVC